MKRQKRAYLFDIFDSAEGAFDLFQNSIRSGMDYDSNINDQFLATVLTRPVKVTGDRAPKTFVRNSDGKTENFAFMVRLEGKNSPHRFLPDPCDIEYTDDANTRRLVFNLIQQHTKVIMSVNSSDRFPEPGDKIVVTLDRNQFGSFKTDVAKNYVKFVEEATTNTNPNTDCQKLSETFKFSELLQGPTVADQKSHFDESITLTVIPLEGFSMRTDNFYQKRSRGYHKGVDLGNRTGLSVRAAHRGRVSIRQSKCVSNESNLDGNLNPIPGVKINDCPNKPKGSLGGNVVRVTAVDAAGNDLGWYTSYMHLSQTGLGGGQKGKIVEAGVRIGTSGNTGNTSGAHLHMELRNSSGKLLNPTWHYPAIKDKVKAKLDAGESAWQSTDLGESSTRGQVIKDPMSSGS